MRNIIIRINTYVPERGNENISILSGTGKFITSFIDKNYGTQEEITIDLDNDNDLRTLFDYNFPKYIINDIKIFFKEEKQRDEEFEEFKKMFKYE